MTAPALRRLDWAGVRARRLRHHHLLDRAPRDRLREAIRDTCGIQAQVQTAAELAIAMRVDGLRRADIAAELWERRRMVRMTTLRGTIHLHAAEDAALWLDATRAGADSAAGERRLAALGLSNTEMETLVAGIKDALDGRALTLRELGEDLVQRVGPWVMEGNSNAFGGSWPYYRSAIYRAAWEGWVCFAPDRGREVVYVRPDQWLPAWQRVDPVTALREALRRYLHAFGPATRQDFARWLAITPAAARRAFELAAGDLEEVDLEGERRFELRSAPPAEGDPTSVRLLPLFDQYLLGSHPRRLVFEAWMAHGLAVGGGGNVPVLAIDGLAAGLWRRTARGRRAQITVQSFAALGRAQLRELEAEVARIEHFSGVETSLVLGEVHARPHM